MGRPITCPTCGGKGEVPGPDDPPDDPPVPVPDLISFDDCCYAIMRAFESNPRPLNYAINYAIAGVGMTGKEQQVQALYILNNITHWRGREATEVRAALTIYGEVE